MDVFLSDPIVRFVFLALWVVFFDIVSISLIVFVVGVSQFADLCFHSFISRITDACVKILLCY